jgi:membrane-associated protease RseP (regulator of RpoE activity)
LQNAREEVANVAGPLILIWMAVMFVSILVHELGHAVTMRFFGTPARIVLYHFGGLATPDTSSYGSSYGLDYGQRMSTRRNSIIILAAGPGAGFLLALFTVAVVYLSGAKVVFDAAYGFPWWNVEGVHNLYAFFLVEYLLWINIFWGLMNLLPVYPLDGGQISREILSGRDPYDGVRKSLWVSVITGAAAAVASLLYFKGDGLMTVFLFGSLAYSSYAALQQFTGGYGGGRPW